MASGSPIPIEDEASGVGFSVSPEKGGELSSVRFFHEGRWVELLRHIDPPAAGFRGGASWLFPAVGRSCLDGVMGFWRSGGQLRPMPMHGFVSERPWELTARDSRRVACLARSDDTTLAMYPFDFALRADYALEGRAIVARAHVAASSRNKTAMPFSLGNHLTLSLAPLRDCAIRTPARDILELSAEGLLTGASTPAPFAAGARLAGHASLADAVLGGYEAGQTWCEVSGPGIKLRVSQRELPQSQGRAHANDDDFHFVFYSDRSSFFCPEPWLGAPDSLNSGKGLVRLEPGAEFSWEMRLELSAL